MHPADTKNVASISKYFVVKTSIQQTQTSNDTYLVKMLKIVVLFTDIACCIITCASHCERVGHPAGNNAFSHPVPSHSNRPHHDCYEIIPKVNL